MCWEKPTVLRRHTNNKVNMPAVKKIRKQEENDYVPSQPLIEGSETEDSGDESEDEWEEEEEDSDLEASNEEEEEVPSVKEVKLPAIRSPRKKKSLAAEVEGKKKPATSQGKKGARKRKLASAKDKDRKVETLTLQKTAPGSSDYEVKLSSKVRVHDMSVVAKKYPRSKYLLDDRHWARVGPVSMKSKGITYDQLFIGRDAHKTTEGNEGKTFKMGLPLRCLQPLMNSLKLMMAGQEQEENVGL